MERLILKGTVRDASQDADDVRVENRIPSVIYGGNRKGALSISVDRGEAMQVLKRIAPSTVIEVELNNEKFMALIVEIQRDVLTEGILHIDFRQVEKGVPVKCKVNLEFVGESPVVKNQGGVLVINRDRVLVSAAPEHLVGSIVVDLSTIATFDKTIAIRDLQLPEGVSIVDDMTASVALVQVPKSKEELAAEEAAEAAADAVAVPVVVTGAETKEEAVKEGAAAKAGSAPDKNAKK